jgi:hypothetical protein
MTTINLDETIKWAREFTMTRFIFAAVMLSGAILGMWLAS